MLVTNDSGAPLIPGPLTKVACFDMENHVFGKAEGVVFITMSLLHSDSD